MTTIAANSNTATGTKKSNYGSSLRALTQNMNSFNTYKSASALAARKSAVDHTKVVDFKAATSAVNGTTDNNHSVPEAAEAQYSAPKAAEAQYSAPKATETQYSAPKTVVLAQYSTPKAAEAQYSAPKTAASTKNTPAKNNMNTKFHLVRPDEKIMATLRNGKGLNMLLGRGYTSGDAIITDRRLYYNNNSGLLNRKQREEKINLKDITGTQICGNTQVPKLLQAILMLAVSLVLMVAVHPIAGLIGMAVSGILFGRYYLTRERFLEINYAGGVIRFPIMNCSMDNVREFMNTIYTLQDEAA